MPLYKFEANDIFRNRIKTHPRTSFLINEGRIIYNKEIPATGLQDEDNPRNIGHMPSGFLSLYEMNVDRNETEHSPDALNPTMIYPFITKSGTATSFKTVSTETFQSFSYGDILSSSFPLSSSIAIEHHMHQDDMPLNCEQNRRHLTALKNTFEHYKYLSPHYAWEADNAMGTWNKGTQEMALVSIPSIFYGSSIKKGTVDLKFYVSGSLAAQLQDVGRNGELVETFGPSGNSATATIRFARAGGGFVSGPPSPSLLVGSGIVLEDSLSTSKTFVFSNTGAPAESTGAVEPATGHIWVQLDGLSSMPEVSLEFIKAVNSVTDLKISATSSAFSSDGVTLTQDVGGTVGNKEIELIGFGPIRIVNQFSGGLDGFVGKVAGVVLYNEGILALTGSWDIHNTYTDYFRACPDCDTATGGFKVSPSWTIWGFQGNKNDKTCNITAGKLEEDPSVTLCPSASWSVDFEGTNYVSVLTMMAHAPKGELNHSNNPTYLKFGQEDNTFSDGTKFVEKNDAELINIVKSVHSNYSESFEKTTYISKVGIYDEDRNLIAIAKVATPVKKTTDREYTFKIKLDF